MSRWSYTRQAAPAKAILRPRPATDTSKSADAVWRRIRSPQLASTVEGLLVDFASGSQVLQPGDEQLVNFFLGEQFLDFRFYLSERNVLFPGLPELWEKFLIVITLN